MTAHDFDTRIGRVAIAWHLEAAGIDSVILSIAERSAYESAHDGLHMTEREVNALRIAVERMTDS